MNRLLIFLAGLLLSGCAHTNTNTAQFVKLTYNDFGPPALAEPLLGNDYQQWQNHGNSRPRVYPIGVIVYRNLELEDVQSQFPASKDKQQDYRYIAYDKAVAFLNDAIESLEKHPEDSPPSLVARLKQTRATIETALSE